MEMFMVKQRSGQCCQVRKVIIVEAETKLGHMHFLLHFCQCFFEIKYGQILQKKETNLKPEIGHILQRFGQTGNAGQDQRGRRKAEKGEERG